MKMWSAIRISVLVIAASAAALELVSDEVCQTSFECGDEIIQAPFDLLADIMNKTFEQIRPFLQNVSLSHIEFYTGRQEFGNFTVKFDDVEITGLGDFRATKIEGTFSPLAATNITILVDDVSLKGIYEIDGMFIFPLATQDIHLFGDGPFVLDVKDIFLTVNATIKSQGGTVHVTDMYIYVGINKTIFDFVNLMGGGQLQDTFNNLLTELGPTIINYYKEVIIETLKPTITKIVECLLGGMLGGGSPTSCFGSSLTN